MEKKKVLKLFIWTYFCCDYTSGLAFAIAKDKEEAKACIRKEYGRDPYSWGELEVRPLTKRVARYVVGGG